MITLGQSFLLGIVEGLTEFLPVSSTGHLILTDHWLSGGVPEGAEKAARDAFAIVIQLGAILAVAVYYRKLLWETFRGLLAWETRAVRLTLALGISFVPAACVGLLLGDVIKSHLFGVKPVVAALAVGGLVMIVVETVRARRGIVGVSSLDEVTPARALCIGIAQCFALWPGTSRSMATIVGGQLGGLSTATAAEYSFLLSLPTLGAACLYDLYKNGSAIVTSSGGNPLPLLVGLATAAVTAWLVIGGFLTYLKRHGLIPFGVYRILLAVALWGFVLVGS